MVKEFSFASVIRVAALLLPLAGIWFSDLHRHGQALQPIDGLTLRESNPGFPFAIPADKAISIKGNFEKRSDGKYITGITEGGIANHIPIPTASSLAPLDVCRDPLSLQRRAPARAPPAIRV